MLNSFLKGTLDQYFHVDAITITFVTIGIITILTLISYSLERRQKSSSNRIYICTMQLLEGISVAVSMIILQHIFHVLNPGSINNGWLYANAQLTILLYCLYSMKNRFVQIINILMPFVYYHAINISRLNDKYLILFLASYIVLVATIIFTYNNMDKLLSSEKLRLLPMAIFGGSWWLMLWVDHNFPFYDVLIMLVVYFICMTIISFYERKLRDSIIHYDDLIKRVNYDELTGSRNRASFDNISAEVYNTYIHEDNIPLTMVMFDIDHFKEFNDEYGHATGDAVLRHVAQNMQSQLFRHNTRGELFRFGGEEFVILFRSTSAQQCVPIIKNLRNNLIDTPFYYNDNKLVVSLSFGISELKPDDTSFAKLFNRVDHYLYQSKHEGRNRMTVEGVTTAFSKVES